MKRNISIGIALAVAIVLVCAYPTKRLVLAQEPAARKAVVQEHSKGSIPALMRMKLDRSKDILEGLSVEDYTLIAQNARAMKLLSMESGWNVIQTKEYAQQSNDFRRACDVIEAAAEDKNINRAALGFVALTVRCVECHSYVRRQTQ